MNRRNRHNSPDINMVIGMVTAQARRISLPTDQRTLRGFTAAPTPMIVDDMTCVEEMGAPATVEKAMDRPEESWDSSEWMGRTRKILEPKVRIILHPPLSVPLPRRAAQATRAHVSISS
jgi:hypothetical protein